MRDVSSISFSYLIFSNDFACQLRVEASLNLRLIKVKIVELFVLRSYVELLNVAEC
jgi:hypothetical protein